jgi:undecaprenyl diphosphate synthase
MPTSSELSSNGSNGSHHSASHSRPERPLASTPAHLDPHKMPRHIAIIMDGNRRWAKGQGWNAIRGHTVGARTTRDVIQECSDLGIEALTLYTFLTENWKRSRPEVAGLMRLISRNLHEELPTMQRNRVRVRHIGRRDDLPDYLLKQIDRSVGETIQNEGMTLSLALNYGGRAELTDAFQNLARQVRAGTLQPEQIDEARIEASLYTHDLPEPDLMIRTGGEFRTSNFCRGNWPTPNCG